MELVPPTGAPCAICRAPLHAGNLGVSHHGMHLCKRCAGPDLDLPGYQAVRRLSDRLVEARAADGTPVAIKLLPWQGGRQRDVAHWRRTAEAAAALVHPNLVRVLGVIEEPTRLGLVRELVPGTDLARHVKERGPLSLGRALAWATHLAVALAWLRARHVVHGRVEPKKVLLEGEIARLLIEPPPPRNTDPSVAHHGEDMGYRELTWLAPEQLENARLTDHRSDLYGLGGVLHFMLAGQPPIAPRVGQRWTPLDWFVHIRDEPPKRLGELRKDVPPPLEELVFACLAKRPEDRPRQVEDLFPILAAG